MSKSIKVTIIEDHDMTRMGLSFALSNHDGIEVLGTASDGMEGVEQALELKPDLVIMDIVTVKNNALENNNQNNGQNVVDYAKQYLGYPYVVGGKNPTTGFDCSGFTRYVFLNYGYSLGATAAGQNNLGTEISKENLQPGDLLLFYDEAMTKIGHTGIYISNGDFIHAANPTRGVVIDNVNTNSYYRERFIVARRIVE